MHNNDMVRDSNFYIDYVINTQDADCRRMVIYKRKTLSFWFLSLSTVRSTRITFTLERLDYSRFQATLTSYSMKLTIHYNQLYIQPRTFCILSMTLSSEYWYHSLNFWWVSAKIMCSLCSDLWLQFLDYCLMVLLKLILYLQIDIYCHSLFGLS